MIRKIAILGLLASAAHGQHKWPNKLTVWFADGTGLYIHTESSLANSPLSTSGSVAVGSGRDSNRVVLDKQGNALFSYDIEARKTEGGTVLIRIKPVDQAKFRSSAKGRADADVPTLTGTREFPQLRIGDAVQVDILYHPTTGERIYDVLTVTDEPPPSATPKKDGERFSLEDIRVVINGKPFWDPPPHRQVWMIGSAAMIHVPGRGEFYLALSPPTSPLFRATGWADHKILRLQAGEDLIEVIGKSNILQKSTYSTVWVYHVPERLQQKLTAALKIYRPEHPEVKAIQKQLAEQRRDVDYRTADDVMSMLPK